MQSDDVGGELFRLERFDLAMRDALAAAYERGRAIESARAESRQALGLPLSREPA